MYRLSRSLTYKLNRLGMRLGALFSRRIADHGISLVAYQVLASLSERSDQTLGELAETTSTPLPTASRLIGTLLRRGLVSRERRPGDERYIRINLTPAGTDLAAELLAAADHYREIVTEGLSADEAARLNELLDRIYGSLDRLEAELPPLTS